MILNRVHAYEVAKTILRNEHNIHILCVDAARNISDAKIMETEEFDDLVNSLVDDTLYYEGEWI